MSENIVEIPEFKTQEDFPTWVKSLSDKQIQSFKTKDWLHIYENLDKLTTEMQIVPYHFTKENALDFAKLYRNYRFEPQQSEYIRKIAREAGEELAKSENISPAALAIAISKDELYDDRASHIASATRSINRIVAKNTAYTPEQRPDTEVFINNNINSGGDAGSISYKVSRIRMNSSLLRDGVIYAAAHESAHINLQTQSPMHKQLFNEGIIAHPEMGEDFQKLMKKNGEYYLHPDDIKMAANHIHLTRTEFNGYRKEPMERYSNLYGFEFERAYRRTSGYASERNAMKVADYLGLPQVLPPAPPPMTEMATIANQNTVDMPPLPNQNAKVQIGRPSSCQTTPSGIELTYKTNGNFSIDELESAIRKRLTKGDKSITDLLDIKSNKTFGEVSITVPNGYNFSSKFDEFARTPPPPPLPPIINKTVISEIETKTPETEIKAHQTEVKTEELHETLKKQAEAAQQKTEVPQTAITDDNLRNTLKTQQKNSGIGGKASSVSNNIDAAFEKIGAALNDNAVGRTINTMDRWRPNNKVAAKAVDKVGVVPVAAIVGSGVAAYEQYKSGDTKGAAATMGKGVVHASVQGAATAVGINAAAKGAAKASEKITAKVVERKAAKTATKSAAKAAGKAAGKAVGKSILKKIPLVSLGAGAYFAYDRAKNGEWGKAGCELLSGALGCFPGVGTAASTAVDCGLAAADVKQSINETKKQQAAEQNKPQTTEQQKNPQMAKRINELRGNKTEQKKAVKAKPIEKNIFDRLKDSFLSR